MRTVALGSTLGQVLRLVALIFSAPENYNRELTKRKKTVQTIAYVLH